MFKNILFDLDGTLTDSSEGITKSMQAALRAIGIDEPDLKELYKFIGPPLRGSMIKFYGSSPEEVNTALEVYRERYTRVGWAENKAYPGMVELVRDLQAAGFRTGMCTAKPEFFAVPIAEKFGYKPYLETITGSTLDGSMDDKAQVVELSLQKWNISTEADKETIVLVGDRREDVLAAHANGIKCIGVGYGFGSYEELSEVGVDFWVETVEDLRQFFLKA
ncbi:MAG: HAD hydrolase-like protein [Phascolarctobacterium sp.]|nr:HAD hydrolase-like protein [Phascolarctobacterium sp.]